MSEWISINDRLPEYADEVILSGTSLFCRVETKFVSSGKRTKTDETGECYYTDRHVSGGVNVTHWQPLPEQPNGK